MHLTRLVLAVLVLVACSFPALGFAGHYLAPSDVYIQIEWPGGLAELMKSPQWVYGWFFMNEDHFAYAGSTDEFQGFLSRYAKLDLAQHTLVIQSGTGSKKAVLPGPRENEFTYDWSLEVLNGTIMNGKPAPPPTVSLHLWTGRINFKEISVPRNVRVHATPSASMAGGQSVAEGAFQYDYPIQLDLSAPAGHTKAVVRLTSLRFHRVEKPIACSDGSDIPGSLTASITAEMLSYPKGKWQVRLALLGDNNVKLAEATTEFENSGVVIGATEKSTRDLTLRWLPIEASVKLADLKAFRLSITEAPLSR